MTMIIVAAMLILPGCEHKPVMSHARFVHLPSMGWLSSLPLSFEPEFDDSTRVYELTLAVRHDNSFAYRNLSLVVDVIAADSTINRRSVNMVLADEFGNWTGGGFGALYQLAVPVAKGITPSQARRIVVWQTMAGCDTLHGLTTLGLVVKPCDKQ